MRQIRPDWSYLRRAFVSWDVVARRVDVTPRASSREWFAQPEVYMEIALVCEKYLDRPFGDDPSPGARTSGSIATTKLLAAELTTELRSAFPDEDILVLADGEEELYETEERGA